MTEAERNAEDIRDKLAQYALPALARLGSAASLAAVWSARADASLRRSTASRTLQIARMTATTATIERMGWSFFDIGERET